MNTRKDYMSGKITHAEYYSQFVTDTIKNVVLHLFIAEGWTIEDVTKSYKNDPHFNFIPLSAWDRKTIYVSSGDSLAEKVCILKEAASQIVENS